MIARSCVLGLVAAAVATGALAADKPPLGTWTGPGSYCAARTLAVIPDGYEGISFGNGMELRRISDQIDLAEVLSFPKSGRTMTFDEMAARLRLSCAEGFTFSETVTSERKRFLRRCDSATDHYGFAYAQRVHGEGDEVAVGSVFVFFGTTPFDLGRNRIKQSLPDAAALAVFETVASALGPCPKGE